MKRTRRVTTAVAPEDDEQQARRPQPSHHVDDYATSHTPEADSMQVQPSASTASLAMESDAPVPAHHSTSHTDAATAATAAAADSAPTTSSSSGCDSLPVTRHLMRPQTVRRSPRRACYLDGLASAEVQSVMQLLDRTSLLRLARCSRRLHSDADADLAWKHQPTLEVKLSTSNPDVDARIRRSLVSHCPGVSVDLDLSPMTGAFVDALHYAIPRITRLHIQVDGQSISEEQWTRTMQHKALDGLRELVIAHPWRLPTEFVDQLVRLPHLHTLRLEGSLRRGESLSALPQLAHLTSLQVTDYDIDAPQAVVQCTGILDLRISLPMLYGAQFREFFTSPNLSQLVRLSLIDFFARGFDFLGYVAVPEADFAVAFHSLTRLRHLCLHCVLDVDAMLSGVSQAPALLNLVINSKGSTQPSPAVLADLLQRTPNLRINLDGLPTSDQAQYAELCASNSRLRIE